MERLFTADQMRQIAMDPSLIDKHGVSWDVAGSFVPSDLALSLVEPPVSPSADWTLVYDKDGKSFLFKGQIDPL